MKKVISILVFLACLSLPFRLIADDSVKWKLEPPIPPQPPSLQEIAKSMADKYGVKDYANMAQTIQCESHWEPNTKGDLKNGVYLARNLGQIHEDTFNSWEKEMGEDLNWNSAYDQLKMIAWAFSPGNEGYRQAWTTYRAIKNGGTYTFYSKQLGKTFTVKCQPPRTNVTISS